MISSRLAENLRLRTEHKKRKWISFNQIVIGAISSELRGKYHIQKKFSTLNALKKANITHEFIQSTFFYETHDILAF
jgi:hypothetical protein